MVIVLNLPKKEFEFCICGFSWKKFGDIEPAPTYFLQDCHFHIVYQLFTALSLITR